ncbi:MAG TPA: carboxypeptidase-like regulatory domain-containing protein [Burkholderiales bacterium]|nr:carboxypeptidase-like regulatory domain-containing protein [Burkholderiales bacterium]
MKTVLLLLALVFAGPAHAGAGAADHDEPGPDDGPPFFGFVKDVSGVPVRDARVTATHKNVSFMANTNATGGYRFNVFAKNVNPDEVVISCAKEGYRQARVFRYPLAKGKPVKSVETECRLQRQN